MIRTSRPWASRHQSSKGADTSIAAAPHADTNAPSGPEYPHVRMLAPPTLASLPNVAAMIRYAEGKAGKHAAGIDRDMRRAPE